MLISVFASIGAQNLGDELILKNEIKLLEEKYGKNTKFIVYSYDPNVVFLKKSNVEYREYFPIGIRNISNIFRNIKNFFIFLFYTLKSDLIVIGGGGIIYDSENQATREPIDQWLFRTKIFYFLRKKVLFFAVGLNIKNKFNLHKVKEIFSQAEVTVRDSYSHDLLKNLGIFSTIVRDPVFSDKKNNSKKSMLIKKVKSFDFTFKDLKDIDFKGKKVAIAFRQGYLCKKKGEIDLDIDGEMDTDEKEFKIINDIINYILENGGSVILLPHSFHKTDLIANDYVFLSNFLRINDKIRIVNSMEDVYKKYIYKEFDICLAMRLHSIILSQVYGIPFIGISYGKKTDEVLDMIEKSL